MTKEKSIGLHIDGIIPITRTGNHAAISMESSFSNVSLKFIHRFIPEFLISVDRLLVVLVLMVLVKKHIFLTISTLINLNLN